MKSQYYSGQGRQRNSGIADLPVANRSELIRPDKYMPDSGLVDAANVALLLGQPLLLTGEPGTGKTQFAYSLAWELNLREPLKFETKSTSVARDLFYTYDAFKRFQDLQSGSIKENALPYLTFQALGIAILRTLPEESKELIGISDFSIGIQSRSIVLIDEIDKAPRDFPNDMLNEIENMFFNISELNKRIEADKKYPPIIIITSNSEKDLPDAFLRRCIYYNIPFPNRERLREIVSNRLGRLVSGSNPFLDDSIDLFYKLRQIPGGLRKNPSIAEILGWLLVLKKFSSEKETIFSQPEIINRTLSTLIKTTNDQEKAMEVVEEWVRTRKT